jgi:hypothetical protein
MSVDRYYESGGGSPGEVFFVYRWCAYDNLHLFMGVRNRKQGRHTRGFVFDRRGRWGESWVEYAPMLWFSRAGGDLLKRCDLHARCGGFQFLRSTDAVRWRAQLEREYRRLLGLLPPAIKWED